MVLTLYKVVTENHTENFGNFKFTLKNNIKEGFHYTETMPLLFRNAKTCQLKTFLSKLNIISNFKPFINYIKFLTITLKF